MKMKMGLTAAALAALAMTSIDASACSTVIIGKDVSKTGTIIVGHNEDNGGRILSAQYYVPAATHKAGEMIKFEPKAAPIPQVEKTHGFYWSQTYSPSGASFSDGFVNDKGVTIVSNACTTIFPENVQPLKDGGIGYGIRRIMAERADSARDAVNIAIDLLGKYGYFAEGRTYTIADANEAWQLAIHQGNTWVARRVKDNEVVYIPNNFMMDKVDATDTENVIVAPGLIERAIKQGRYKPAKAGVYSDFNYRVAVQPASKRAAAYNQSRNNLAWKKITGKEITDPEKFPYSVVAKKKFGVKEVKELLRLHEKDIGKDFGWYHKAGNGLCRPTTHESLIVVQNEHPELVQAFRTLARPCESPFVPFFPLAKPAAGTSFMDAATATAEHFKGTIPNFSYNAAWPVWTFVSYANATDFLTNTRKKNTEFLLELEKELTENDSAVKAQAALLYKTSPAKALSYLKAYNERAFREAEGAVAERFAKIAPHQAALLADTIDSTSDAAVEMVLFSDKKLDATKVDLSKVYAGLGRASIGNSGEVAKLAKPLTHRYADVNGDGKRDLVVTFSQKALATGMKAGATYDVWFYGFDKEKRPLTAFDTAAIK